MIRDTERTVNANRPDHPAALAVAWDAIPLALRSLPQWVAWEHRWVDKRAAWAKVPLDVRGVSAGDGYSRAKSDRPQTWTTFDRVRSEWAREYATFRLDKPCGPGFVFRAGGGLVGIDLDKCRDPHTGALNTYAQQIVARFPGYWEVSPSGTGLKGVFFGALPGEGRGRKVDFPDGYGIEIYDRGRYFAITGQRIAGAAADVTACAEQLVGLLDELEAIKRGRLEEKQKSRPQRPGRVNTATAPPHSSANITDPSERVRRARRYLSPIEGAVAFRGGDNATFRAACVLVLGFDLTPLQAFPLFANWNQTCQPPWDESWLWRKLHEADKQTGPRGELLHATGPARSVGYDNLTAEEIDELIRGIGVRVAGDLASKPTLPDAPTEECAFHAARDVSDEIALSHARCKNTRPVTMRKNDAIDFVCDRPCGNGSLCRPCLMNRHHVKVRESNAYLIRTSVAVAEPRTVYVALVDSIEPGKTKWNTLTNAVRDAGGQRCSILTDDPVGVSERLGRLPGASRFFLKDNSVEEESGSVRLWCLSLSTRTTETVVFAGVTFRRVSVAAAVRAVHHAVESIPLAPPPGTTFKPWHASSGWGDKEVREPSNVKLLGASKFNVKQATQILDRSGVTARSVPFDRDHGSEPGIGWLLPPVGSLAMRLWLGGVDAHLTPTVDRVVMLAQHWLRLLPADLGAGYRVENVLRQHVWHLTLYDITPELRAADAEDRANETALAEAASLYTALREAYRGREHEAEGLVAELLA